MIGQSKLSFLKYSGLTEYIIMIARKAFWLVKQRILQLFAYLNTGLRKVLHVYTIQIIFIAQLILTESATSKVADFM